MMNREPLVEAALNKMAFTLMATFTEQQLARLLVGYISACELYVRDARDGQGKLPQGLQDFHSEAKTLLGLSCPSGNGDDSPKIHD